MEVVYFLISFIEIALTVFIVKKMLPIIFKIEEKNNLAAESLPAFYKVFKKIKEIFHISACASKVYKKANYYKKYIDKLMKIKSIIAAVEFLKGKRIKKRFGIFTLLRKVFFFV